MYKDDLASWLDNNPLLDEQYTKPNYTIRYCNPQSKLCLILFSGNGLYYPNTEEEFINRIIKDNRYEWQNITQGAVFKKKCAKIIFLRDIYKQWYITGINKTLNTIEKVINWLKKETEGYTIITAGTSAGGYAAVLFGISLKAEKIFSFSGQFFLTDIEKNPFLKQYSHTTQYNKYYDLSQFCILSKSPIFYFYPALCEYDVCQANAVKNIPTVYSFRIKSEVHGYTVLPKNYRFLFWKHTKKLLKLHMRFKEKNITSEKLLAASSISYTIFYLFFSIYQRIKNSLKKYVISNMGEK